MELIRQGRTHHELPRFAIHFKLPLYLWFMLCVFLGVLVMVATVTALARSMQPPSDPFLDYADILPGQPRSTVVMGTGFTQGVIRHNTLMVPENTLRLGDLVALWGTPEVQEYGNVATFVWRDGAIVASTLAYSGRFSLFLPVWSVSFTEMRLPRES